MKLFKNGELKLLWPFYLDALISPLLFFLPAFLVLYFRDMNFSLFQISILIAAMPLATILFEIPTGAIADLYGRKFSVLFGAIVSSIGLFLIYFTTNYYLILFSFAIVGIGSTFNSGAREAWITDLIKSKRKDYLHGFFAKSSSLDSLSLVFSGIIGAIIVKNFGTHTIWIFAGTSFLTSFLLLSLAEEKFVKRNSKIKDSFKNIIKQSSKSIKYSANHPVLFLFLIASSILVFAGVFTGDMAWVTLLQELGFKDHYFGYMWSAMGLAGIFAPLITLKFIKKGKERKFIALAIILGSLVLLPVIVINSYFIGVGILLGWLFLFHSRFPLERVFFQRFITSKLRATVGSVESMLLSLVGILSLPLAGLSIDYLGARYTIFMGGILMIPSAIIYLSMKDKLK